MATRIFLTRPFAKFRRENRIEERSLVEAVARAEAGLIDADPGGGVVKQRIARPGSGRSAGYRTLIAFRSQDRALFVFGFLKSERANVSSSELAALKLFAADFLSSEEAALTAALGEGRLIEIVLEGPR